LKRSDLIAPNDNMALATLEDLLESPYYRAEWALDKLSLSFESDSQISGHAKNLRTALANMIERERSKSE